MIQWQKFSVNISGNCIELENADGGTGTIPRSGSVLPDYQPRELLHYSSIG
jgi:hypothetical protein